jgi:hypothetical protein
MGDEDEDQPENDLVWQKYFLRPLQAIQFISFKTNISTQNILKYRAVLSLSIEKGRAESCTVILSQSSE